jgi:hypothetical protein
MRVEVDRQIAISRTCQKQSGGIARHGALQASPVKPRGAEHFQIYTYRDNVTVKRLLYVFLMLIFVLSSNKLVLLDLDPRP